MPAWHDSRPVYHLLNFVASNWYVITSAEKKKKMSREPESAAMCSPTKCGQADEHGSTSTQQSDITSGLKPEHVLYYTHMVGRDLKKKCIYIYIKKILAPRRSGWTSAFVSSLIATHWLLTTRHIPTYLRFWLVKRDHSGVCFSSFRRIITTLSLVIFYVTFASWIGSEGSLSCVYGGQSVSRHVWTHVPGGFTDWGFFIQFFSPVFTDPSDSQQRL